MVFLFVLTLVGLGLLFGLLVPQLYIYLDKPNTLEKISFIELWLLFCLTFWYCSNLPLIILALQNKCPVHPSNMILLISSESTHNGWRSWNFGFYRPALTFLFAWTITQCKYHTILRLSSFAFSLYTVCIAILSSMELEFQLACMSTEQCTPPDSFKFKDIEMMRNREYIEIIAASISYGLLLRLTNIIANEKRFSAEHDDAEKFVYLNEHLSKRT